MKGPSPVLFLVGPSAVGKSSVALELAGRLDAEIVSCDAMQVYREVSIASDKPSAAMRARAVHHLVDVVSVEEEFNAGRYRALALAAIEDIRARGKTPLVTGGSGMYMMVLLDGIFEEGEADGALRVKLEELSLPELYQELLRVDPLAAAKITANDRQRIIRALLVYRTSGIPISQRQKDRKGLWGSCDIRVFGLERPREELYARVERRVEEFFAAGLVDEIKALEARKLSLTGARIIGVPEVTGFLRGEYDLERAKYLMKLHTRRYVKRQMTWFRRDKRIEWVMAGCADEPCVLAGRIMEKL